MSRGLSTGARQGWPARRKHDMSEVSGKIIAKVLLKIITLSFCGSETAGRAKVLRLARFLALLRMPGGTEGSFFDHARGLLDIVMVWVDVGLLPVLPEPRYWPAAGRARAYPEK